MAKSMNADAVVRGALEGTGIELVASAGIEIYDAAAPASLRSAVLMPGALGVVVAASAGPELWRHFQAYMADHPASWDAPHPYDAFVASRLAHADDALGAAGIPFRRFDAAFEATPRLDFLALGRLTGLGHKGPFALCIHEAHGPWWALRGAWLVGAEVDPPLAHRPPCQGCSAPCVGGWENSSGGMASATPEVRGACVVGQSSRYDPDQIAFHYDREATIARLRAAPERAGDRSPTKGPVKSG
jgi:hypothetical protein